MSDSVRPHRRQPTRLPRPWDSPGKNTGVGCHFLLQCMKVKSESEVTQSCPTLCDPMDCSLSGSSVHGIFQARILEWCAIAFSEALLRPRASLVAQRLKCLPPMWETRVRSLDREDPLEKEMAIHSSILAWRIHGRRSLVGYSPWGRKELDTTERLHFLLSFFKWCMRPESLFKKFIGVYLPYRAFCSFLLYSKVNQLYV